DPDAPRRCADPARHLPRVVEPQRPHVPDAVRPDRRRAARAASLTIHVRGETGSEKPLTIEGCASWPQLTMGDYGRAGEVGQCRWPSVDVADHGAGANAAPSPWKGEGVRCRGPLTLALSPAGGEGISAR